MKAHPRIIPALAGNTRGRLLWSDGPRDHPRSRGEYASESILRACQGGSSPLSRGILMSTLEEVKRNRIIPALAGNTFILRADFIVHQDHPRSRGEYVVHPRTGA